MAGIGNLTLDCGCRIEIRATGPKPEEDHPAVVRLHAARIERCPEHRDDPAPRPRRRVWPSLRRPPKPRRPPAF